jgi:transcriptional regulator with XRE-family HTH domain
MGDGEDPVMARMRDWLKQSGMTQQDLGVKMGYAEEGARKSVSQFLKSKNPTIAMLRKFADAAGIPIEELVAKEKPKSKKK